MSVIKDDKIQINKSRAEQSGFFFEQENVHTKRERKISAPKLSVEFTEGRGNLRTIRRV